MRPNQTTYMRAIAQAKKLQPETKQINNSFFFEVASTSILDGWHRVNLGANKFNILLGSVCDCGGQGRFKNCVHVASAFLQYTSNLETRLWKGCDYITDLEDKKENSEEAFNLWADLLDRYERCCDLLKAIEQGFDISQLTGPFKERLATSFDSILLSA